VDVKSRLESIARIILLKKKDPEVACGQRVNQPLRFRHHAAGVLRFHASAFHLGSELTRLELKGEHGLSRGGLRRR